MSQGATRVPGIHTDYGASQSSRQKAAAAKHVGEWVRARGAEPVHYSPLQGVLQQVSDLLLLRKDDLRFPNQRDAARLAHSRAQHQTSVL